MESNKKPYCVLPFVHSFFDVRGRYNVCCNGTHDDETTVTVSDMNVEQWFYSDIMDKVRQDMLNGTRNPMCDHCYKKDDIGLSGPNNYHNQIWSHKNVDYNNPRPMFFDLKPSNHCNLACIFCTPSSSDKIEKITASLPDEDRPARWAGGLNFMRKVENTMTFDHSVIEYILENIEHLEILKFTGGEPFLIDDVLEIITKVCEIKPNIKLMFTSNGSAVPKDFYPVLQKIDDVHIKISIDAIDDLYSYIRYPSKWELYTQRLENLLQSLPDVTFDINALITNMSLEQIPMIRDWYKDISARHSNLKWITIDPNLKPENNESSLYMMDPVYLQRIKDKLITKTSDWDMEDQTDKQINNVYKKIDDAITHNIFNSDRFRKEFIRQNKIRQMNIIDLVGPITREFFEKYLTEE